jgi:hypothetical protein
METSLISTVDISVIDIYQGRGKLSSASIWDKEDILAGWKLPLPLALPWINLGFPIASLFTGRLCPVSRRRLLLEGNAPNRSYAVSCFKYERENF